MIKCDKDKYNIVQMALILIACKSRKNALVASNTQAGEQKDPYKNIWKLYSNSWETSYTVTFNEIHIQRITVGGRKSQLY